MPKKRARAKGEGTISRRADGRYEGRLSLGTDDGKRVRQVVYGVSRAEVAEKLQALRIVEGRIRSPKLTVEEHLSRWFLHGASRWEPQTQRTYRGWISNHILPHLASRQIAKLEPDDIRAWMRRLDDDGVGALTRKRALSTLRTALKELVDEGRLLRNPCDVVKPPKTRRAAFRVPSPSEVKRLIDAAQPFWVRVLLMLAFTSTMRQGEIFALTWDDVDFSTGSVRVQHSLACNLDGVLERRAPKNDYSIRTIDLPASTMRALRALQERQQQDGYVGDWVFPDSDGGPLRKSNLIRREYRRALVAADLPRMRFHSLRHAGNSLLIAQGEAPLALSKRMGHADTRMTLDTYGHQFENAGRRVAESMERGLSEYGIGDVTDDDPTEAG